MWQIIGPLSYLAKNNAARVSKNVCSCTVEISFFLHPHLMSSVLTRSLRQFLLTSLKYQFIIQEQICTPRLVPDFKNEAIDSGPGSLAKHFQVATLDLWTSFIGQLCRGVEKIGYATGKGARSLCLRSSAHGVVID